MTSHLSSSLFRSEAFEHHFREQESRGVLNTSIRHRWLIAIITLALIFTVLSYAFVAQVEVVYRAAGVLRSWATAAHRDEVVVMVRLHGNEVTPGLEPGSPVRLELLGPARHSRQSIDGRLTSLEDAGGALVFRIVLDKPEASFVSWARDSAIPVRIHARVCKRRLYRFAISAAPSGFQQ